MQSSVSQRQCGRVYFRKALLLGVLNAMCMILLLLIAHPFAETGVMDDWSYKGIAQSYLYTGKFVYNGWANAMLGWLIPYGALFMHFLGPTFLAVRASTLPLAFGCVVLFQICASRFGISSWNSSLGALTLGLSPIFLPLAASYMTDIGALLVLMVCLLLCQQAVLAGSARNSCIWLIAAGATNLAGGTVRQIAWLGVLVMVPCAGWVLRHRRRVLATALVTWLCSTISIFCFLWWFRRQPYTVPEQIFRTPGEAVHFLDPEKLGVFSLQIVSSVLCFLLLLMPVLVAWLPELRTSRGRSRTRFCVALGITFSAFFIARSFLHEAIYAPWLQHVLDSLGFWPLIETNGTDAPVIGEWGRILLSAVVLITAVSFFAQVRRQYSRSVPDLEVESHVISASAMNWMLVPFLTTYGLLLLPRAHVNNVFDRYLLAILPAALMLLIRKYQESVRERLPAISLVVILLFAGYSTMALHDTFAAMRAVTVFTARLAAHGISRKEISEGWVSDALAQLELDGHIDNPNMDHPRDVPQPWVDPRVPARCAGWFPITALRPTYFMVMSPQEDCFKNSSIQPVTFMTWLPPHRHALYAQQLK